MDSNSRVQFDKCDGLHLYIQSRNYRTNSIERFIEDQAFLPSYDLAPPKPSPPLSSVSKLNRLHTGRPKREEISYGRWGREWGKRQIIWRRESLVLYKSWNTLWTLHRSRIAFEKYVGSFRGIYCTEKKIYLQLTHRETVVEGTREKGRGVIDLSTGSYISLVLLWRWWGRCNSSRGGRYKYCAAQVCTLFSSTVNPWESFGWRVY